MKTVATVLTVYGIETHIRLTCCFNSNRLLQQYLPFTVLKQQLKRILGSFSTTLQQYLPFTVLKLQQ